MLANTHPWWWRLACRQIGKCSLAWYHICDRRYSKEGCGNAMAQTFTLLCLPSMLFCKMHGPFKRSHSKPRTNKQKIKISHWPWSDGHQRDTPSNQTTSKGTLPFWTTPGRSYQEQAHTVCLIQSRSRSGHPNAATQFHNWECSQMTGGVVKDHSTAERPIKHRYFLVLVTRYACLDRPLVWFGASPGLVKRLWLITAIVLQESGSFVKNNLLILIWRKMAQF